ncbi:Putative ribonuclease H protein At1g65750, partial [Linum perenne]
RVEAHIGWKAGPSDYITINTDGSVLHPHSHAVAGGILRNHLGRPICIFAANLGVCSIMKAELRAAEFGLVIAWDKGFMKIHLQLDSLAAITASLGGHLSNHFASKVLRYRELLSREWEVDLRHVYREENRAANYLATLGHSLPLGNHNIAIPDSDPNRILFNNYP